MKIDDVDMAVIFLCSLPSSYDHLVTTLTYKKDTINLDVITSTLFSHSQRRKCVEEGNQGGNGLYAKGLKIVGEIRKLWFRLFGVQHYKGWWRSILWGPSMVVGFFIY